MISVWGLAHFRRWGFWVALILFSGLGVCLLQTSSRGGIIALFAGLVPILLRAPRPWPKARIAGAVLSVWAILGATLFLQVNEQRTGGTRAPDRSMTSRLAVWKNAPAMMADAPGGWGHGDAGKAYMQWYQPLERTDQYRTLVNSHLTWLVEFSWPWRLLYLCGWAAIFLICAHSRKARGISVALGVWISFFISAFFNSIAESPWLWGIPATVLAAVLIWRWRAGEWPRPRLWLVPPATAVTVLFTLWCCSGDSKVQKSGNACQSTGNADNYN